MANLNESILAKYPKRIKLAESLYSKAHDGDAMDINKKVMLATTITNTSKFLKEALDTSSVTQRADLDSLHKFCIDITNVAIPNCVGPELVMVYPMSSMTGYVAYIKYTNSTTKGQTEAGSTYNTPFALGKIYSDYTGARVVESVTAGTGAQALAWAPVLQNVFVHEGNAYDIKLVKAGVADIYGYYNDEDKKFYESRVGTTYSDQITVASDTKVAYVYDNETVPLNNLPRINAEIQHITLMAKPRRIAVAYSQIAEFQAKQDYGFDLGEQLKVQAAGRLAYDIDTAIIETLDEAAGAAKPGLIWSKSLPTGVSKRD